ncbi:DUF2812 domain-containing protein [Neobacillus novalis]|uniref:DUF2812 domain-containing protein n=1 Tax=Neobacillus novalis TaxID=220687 RepID=A0AA95S6V8_9BACI|nr:DUF2812 domain-containing protein [Neobacillus novalis]WHY84075.1 DUF2812 domain-containing protein [Neobacillus novalis]
MKRVMRKIFVDFEREEKFLNEMAANGLALTQYSFCKYVFEDAPKGEYIYRLELLEHPINHQESQDYIQFMEETGAELVTSYHRWVYFRKKAADGEFTIYSDNDSKLRHYKRIMLLFWFVIGLNMFAGLLNLFLGNLGSSIGRPPINTYLSIVSFSIAVLLLLFLVIPLRKKIARLDKEKKIRE